MWRTDDPVRDFEDYDRMLQERLRRLPVCSECLEPIQEEFYHRIHGKNLCNACLEYFSEYNYELED